MKKKKKSLSAFTMVGKVKPMLNNFFLMIITQRIARRHQVEVLDQDK